MIYIPYKFKIKNNRLRDIGIGGLFFRENNEILVFNNNGNEIYNNTDRLYYYHSKRYILDSLFNSLNFSRYFEVRNQNIIPPYSSKILYFYKAFKFKKNIIDKNLNKKDYIEIGENFYNNESIYLQSKNKYSVPKKIIDSLYKIDEEKNMYFVFNKNQKQGYYRIKYNLLKNNQDFADYYDTIKVIRKNNDKNKLQKILSNPVWKD
ncbi:hypothetical protein [Chryseobacterium sp. YIM B08800]|uniref:hypothetical protein n=1 Tax=Chryseobacterium sp. YIM B08800 TaxID=2984136 RepID=UPI00223F82DE|nr:hypothetical protein [Chryseobacterium sp. YIM B08800]